MHVQRAEVTAPPPAAAGGEFQLVSCHLAGQEYGLPIARVREILRVAAITAIPHAPPHFRGIVNLRGRIVPILDLRARLGLPEAELTNRSRVIVVESGRRLLGLLVDGASHVLRLPCGALESAPQEAEGALAFVCAVATVAQRLILVLDLDQALRREFERGLERGDGSGPPAA